MTIRFAVHGTPIQQGSSRAFVRNGRAVITSDTRRDLRSWRRRVAVAARATSGGTTIDKDTPVTVRLVFRMPKPKTMPKGRIAPTVTPDLDKLLRAVLDSLTIAEVYADDCQVFDAHAVKLYETPQHPPGVYVEIETVQPGLFGVAS